VWGLRYVDELLLRDRDTNADGTLDERLYALQDANWNVVALCDESAAVEERYAYTPYGVVAFLTPAFGPRSSSSFDWTYLYTGRERDGETGLQYSRNRYLHPPLGCWLTRDPMGFEAGDNNFYRYVGNAPTNDIDAFALEKECTIYLFDGSDRGTGPGTAYGKHFECGTKALAQYGRGDAVNITATGFGSAIYYAHTKGCCIKYLAVLDHGAPGGACQTGSRWINDQAIDQLCPFMCCDSSIRLYGCWSAGGATAKNILNRCNRVSDVSGCTGLVTYGGVVTGWLFARCAAPPVAPQCTGEWIFFGPAHGARCACK
jgi:RHS repeat-associated protein